MKRARKVVFHLCILAFGLLMIYPVLWMVGASFGDNVGILQGTFRLIPETLNPANYITGWRGFGGVSFAVFFRNSLVISVIATAGCVISSSLAAYAFTFLRFPGKRFWFVCMIGTLLLPSQVLMIPQYLIFHRLGMVPGMLPLVLPYFCGQAFFIYQMMQFLATFPRELILAARVDGCSLFGIYAKIVLPMMKPVLITTIVIQFYWKWNDYLGPLLYLSRPASYPVSIALKLFTDSASTTDYGAMFAMSTLSLIPVFVIFLVFNRRLVQGRTTSGIKS